MRGEFATRIAPEKGIFSAFSFFLLEGIGFAYLIHYYAPFLFEKGTIFFDYFNEELQQLTSYEKDKI